MLSKKLMLPLGLLAIVFLNLAVFIDRKYAYGMVPFVVLMAVVYMMSPQINWWWYQYQPPKLPEPLVKMLLARLPYFRHLPPEEKTQFATRVALYLEANEFKAQIGDNVPEDVKAVIAASAVQLTFGLEDYLLHPFEHIIVYPHPFPSPQYEQWHASEHYQPDGAILFSAEQLMAGFAAPQKFFHTGLYEYGRVLQICHPELALPKWGPEAWRQMEQISGFSQEAVQNWIGLPGTDLTAVALAHFFVFPKKFRAVLPDAYRQLAAALRQDPLVPGVRKSDRKFTEAE